MTEPRTELRAMLDGWKMTAVRVPMRADSAWDTFDDKLAEHRMVYIAAPHTHAQWHGTYSAGMFIVAQEADNKKRLKGLNPKSVAWREAYEDLRHRWTPLIEDVIGSVLADASSVRECPTFRVWCEDHGYDEGNPADALDTFNACKESEAFVQQAFGPFLERAYELAAEL